MWFHYVAHIQISFYLCLLVSINETISKDCWQKIRLKMNKYNWITRPLLPKQFLYHFDIVQEENPHWSKQFWHKGLNKHFKDKIWFTWDEYASVWRKFFDSKLIYLFLWHKRCLPKSQINQRIIPLLSCDIVSSKLTRTVKHHCADYEKVYWPI